MTIDPYSRKCGAHAADAASAPADDGIVLRSVGTRLNAMIQHVAPEDLQPIAALITDSITACINAPSRDRGVLIKDSIAHARWGLAHPRRCVHYLYRGHDRVAGVILVKHYWNIANLFVLPEYQGRGIGRCLLDRALVDCAAHSPHSVVRLNSSDVARDFYRRYGFRQAGPSRALPGGCTPFEYQLADAPATSGSTNHV